jgi:hypothetical protein
MRSGVIRFHPFPKVQPSSAMMRAVMVPARINAC